MLRLLQALFKGRFIQFGMAAGLDLLPLLCRTVALHAVVLDFLFSLQWTQTLGDQIGYGPVLLHVRNEVETTCPVAHLALDSLIAGKGFHQTVLGHALSGDMARHAEIGFHRVPDLELGGIFLGFLGVEVGRGLAMARFFPLSHLVAEFGVPMASAGTAFGDANKFRVGVVLGSERVREAEGKKTSKERDPSHHESTPLLERLTYIAILTSRATVYRFIAKESRGKTSAGEGSSGSRHRHAFVCDSASPTLDSLS